MPQPHLFCQVCAPSCTLCALWYLAPSEAWGLASGVTESPPYPAPINPLSRTEHGSTKTSGWDQLFDATDTAEPLGDPAEDPLVGKAPSRLSPSPSLSRLSSPCWFLLEPLPETITCHSVGLLWGDPTSGATHLATQELPCIFPKRSHPASRGD